MLAALVIVFREVFEAGLIVGIVLAATRSVTHRGWWTAAGIAGGVLGAFLVAFSINWISELFAGAGQEMLNAAILGLAVIMLTWHNVWMAWHGREMAQQMRAAGAAVAAGSRAMALAVVVGVAVLRQGAEVVLFLYGIAVDGSTNLALLAGGVIGLALGALVSVLVYFGLIALPTQRLFAVTTGLIIFLAAGMAAQSVVSLEQANIFQLLGRVVWDTSGILPDTSLPGRALHTLIGYTDRPTALQLLVYLATIAITGVLMKANAPRVRAPAAAE